MGRTPLSYGRCVPESLKGTKLSPASIDSQTLAPTAQTPEDVNTAANHHHEPLGNFHVFPLLPVEIPLAIWKIHKDSKTKIRHTLIQDFFGCRTYDAFGVKRHVYVNTLITRNPGEQNGTAIVHPDAGEEISKAQLTNVKYWTGHDGASALDRLDDEDEAEPRTWHTIQKPSAYISMNFEFDIVVLTDCALTDDHWIFKVQLNLGPTEAEHLQCSSTHFLSRMTSFKTLYVFRYFTCSCGPPRKWRGFDLEMLDDDDFLSADDAVRIHSMGCRRRLDPYLQIGEDLEARIKQLLEARAEDVVVLHDDPAWRQDV
ncbi:hypothetical protein DL765_000583 [Monosporascus sp. GIB2]|nr:hypothetical protein DL765_000583 [Monosporascus sp. GIB2]